MISKDIDIINKLGLHARAAAKLATLARSFHSHIQLEKEGHTVNAKSIMGIMMLAAGQGTQLTLHIDGDDEVSAATALTGLIQDRFGEAA